MFKQIRIFKCENIKELEDFLVIHADANILTADTYAIKRDKCFILSTCDKNKLKYVQRPKEKPYQTSIIYAIYDIIGEAREGQEVKTKVFSSTNIEDINNFLIGKDVKNIKLLPSVEKTGPLDNYVPGEYGPVPDRSPMLVKSHKLLIVFKE